MGRIITFYSYKGGVGRSMALANIAVLLARRGLNVLTVDWDLEAPGLDRYFASLKMETDGEGLLPLLQEARKPYFPSYRDYLWTVHDTETNFNFSFLSSGRESDSNYTKNLNDFDWRKFFTDQHGGDFIESLRREWRSKYDVVLIDSRTGLTDSGGVCTIQLPDIVIPMFTANYQSLYGVRDVMRLAQSARQSLAYDRMPLTIFPLPSRFGVRAEFNESREWIERFEEALSEFYQDWLPNWASPKAVLERVKVPQIDYFGFGEKLAVIEHGVTDPESMGFVYDYITDILAKDFENVESWLGPKAKERLGYVSKEKRGVTSDVSSGLSGDYEFDIFVSFARSSLIDEWLRDFIHLLSEFTTDKAGYKLNIFFDVAEIQAEEIWSNRLQVALSRSKLLLIVATKKYFSSSWALAEWKTFQKRSDITGVPLIIPVLLQGGDTFPDEFKKIHFFNMSNFHFSESGSRNSKLYYDFQNKVNDLAIAVAKRLKKVPPFDDSWPVISPSEVEVVNAKISFRPPAIK